MANLVMMFIIILLILIFSKMQYYDSFDRPELLRRLREFGIRNNVVVMYQERGRVITIYMYKGEEYVAAEFHTLTDLDWTLKQMYEKLNDRT